MRGLCIEEGKEVGDRRVWDLEVWVPGWVEEGCNGVMGDDLTLGGSSKGLMGWECSGGQEVCGSLLGKLEGVGSQTGWGWWWSWDRSDMRLGWSVRRHGARTVGGSDVVGLDMPVLQ